MEIQGITWQLRQQFRVIEIIAQWEGRVNGQHLQRVFNTSSSTTSAKLFRQYNEAAPGNLQLSPSRRGYVITTDFKPRFSAGLVDEYLALLNSHPMLNPQLCQTEGSAGNIEMIRMPNRAVTPDVLGAVIQAIQDRTRLEIIYHSKSRPEGVARLITPHALVYSGMRWHTRVWCEERQKFIDMVLTRMRLGAPDNGPALPQSAPELDDDWNVMMAIRITPNPKLSAAQQALVRMDYGLPPDQPLVITARRALVHYQLLAMNIHMDYERFKPESHPLVVINHQEVRPYIFR